MQSSSKFISQSEAGKLAIKIHNEVANIANAGTNLLDIELLIIKVLKDANMQAAFKGYKGYPANSCICVNNEIVHGIPKDYIIKDGDVVTVDFGITHNGYMVDTARTYLIGNVSDEIKRLHSATQKALDNAISAAKPGANTKEIGKIIQETVENAGFNIVEDLTGHGISTTLQEKPTIYNYKHEYTNETLKVGDTIAIEPITSIKKTDIELANDGWTIMPKTETITMQIEDTVFIDDKGAITLTR